MKKLFVFGPAVVLVAVLLNSFGQKEKQGGNKTIENVRSFAGAMRYDSPMSLLAGVPKMAAYGPDLPNAIYRSADGGQTWEEISQGLPANDEPLNLFVGESDLYVNVKNVMYHAKTGLQTPVWEKENVPDLKSSINLPSTSIAFNPSGTMAFGYEGDIYRKTPGADTWMPIYTDYRRNALRGVFEMADGTLLFGYDHGLYKSSDKGQTWKQVHKGQVINVVESDGVLMAAARSANGIIRSTDNGENWEPVNGGGGVPQVIEPVTGGFAVISYSGATDARRMRISLDKGETWQDIDNGIPPSLFTSSVKQVGNCLVCGHPDGIFRSCDMGRSWARVFTGDGKNVFRIHVSGDVLYAVAGNAGC